MNILKSRKTKSLKNLRKSEKSEEISKNLEKSGKLWKNLEKLKNSECQTECQTTHRERQTAENARPPRMPDRLAFFLLSTSRERQTVWHSRAVWTVWHSRLVSGILSGILSCIAARSVWQSRQLDIFATQVVYAVIFPFYHLCPSFRRLNRSNAPKAAPNFSRSTWFQAGGNMSEKAGRFFQVQEKHASERGSKLHSSKQVRGAIHVVYVCQSFAVQQRTTGNKGSHSSEL